MRRWEERLAHWTAYLMGSSILLMICVWWALMVDFDPLSGGSGDVFLGLEILFLILYMMVAILLLVVPKALRSRALVLWLAAACFNLFLFIFLNRNLSIGSTDLFFTIPQLVAFGLAVVGFFICRNRATNVSIKAIAEQDADGQAAVEQKI